MQLSRTKHFIKIGQIISPSLIIIVSATCTYFHIIEINKILPSGLNSYYTTIFIGCAFMLGLAVSIIRIPQQYLQFRYKWARDFTIKMASTSQNTPHFNEDQYLLSLEKEFKTFYRDVYPFLDTNVHSFHEWQFLESIYKAQHNGVFLNFISQQYQFHYRIYAFLFVKSFHLSDFYFKEINDFFLNNGINYSSFIRRSHEQDALRIIFSNFSQNTNTREKLAELIANYHFPLNNYLVYNIVLNRYSIKQEYISILEILPRQLLENFLTSMPNSNLTFTQDIEAILNKSQLNSHVPPYSHTKPVLKI